MKIETVVELVLIAGIGYVAYQVFGFAKKAGGAAVDATSSAIADFWTWLTLPDYMTVQGNLVFDNGAAVPLASATVKQSPGGAVVASYAGHYYQLSPSDANGNWPATLIQ